MRTLVNPRRAGNPEIAIASNRLGMRGQTGKIIISATIAVLRIAPYCRSQLIVRYKTVHKAMVVVRHRVGYSTVIIASFMRVGRHPRPVKLGIVLSTGHRNQRIAFKSNGLNEFAYIINDCSRRYFVVVDNVNHVKMKFVAFHF